MLDLLNQLFCREYARLNEIFLIAWVVIFVIAIIIEALWSSYQLKKLSKS